MILEWRDDVRLGMMRLWSALSLVGGRSLAPVRGRRLKEGAIVAGSTVVLSSWTWDCDGSEGNGGGWGPVNYNDGENRENIEVCVD